MPVAIPGGHGATIKTPEELGITNDPEKMAAYQDLINHLFGTVSSADKMNKAAIGAATVGIGGAALGGASGAAGAANTAKNITGALTGGGATGAGAAGAGSGNSLVDPLLLAGSVAAGAADKAKQQGLVDKSTNYATSQYDAKAPLRAQAIAGLQNTSAPDLSAIFSNAGNVYDRQRRGLPPLTTAPSAAAQLTGGNALSGAIAQRVGAPPPPPPPPPPPTAAPSGSPGGALGLSSAIGGPPSGGNGPFGLLSSLRAGMNPQQSSASY